MGSTTVSHGGKTPKTGVDTYLSQSCMADVDARTIDQLCRDRQ